MASCVFAESRYNTTVCCHKTKNIRTLVHGDDFVSSGHQEGLEWLHGKMKKRFNVGKKVMGARENEDKEGKVLNRIYPCELFWMGLRGWSRTRGDRHQDAEHVQHANPVCTPGEEERWMQGTEDEGTVDGGRSVRIQGFAKANFVRSDRTDLQYSVKEVCRSIPTPTKVDMRNAACEDLDEYSDSDWAGLRTGQPADPQEE